MSKADKIAKLEKSNLAARLESFIKPLSKIGSQKHLMALRDGFVLTLPFTIAGAMAILFVTIVFGGWGAQKTSLIGLMAHADGSTMVNFLNLSTEANTWALQGKWLETALWGQKIFSVINGATLGSISLYIALMLGYSMSSVKRLNSNLIGGAMSISIFLIITGGSKDYFGSTGMIPALIAGLLGVEIYSWFLNNDKLKIKMPASVPPAVGRAFSSLFPAFLTLITFMLANVLASGIFMGVEKRGITSGESLLSLAKVINLVFLQPFLIFARNGGDIALIYVYVFVVGILWFFGLHGSNTIDGAFAPIGILLWIDNMNGGQNVAMAQVWNGFGFFGGSGGTLSAVILTLIIIKKASQQREVAKFALPAGIFNINEPVIFGFPIIFNMTYLIPFVFAVPISLIWPIIAIKTGLMNAPTLIAPWTAPPILYGLIVTQFDWRSIPVSLLVLLTQLLIWTPFILVKSRMDNKEMKKEVV